MTYRRSKTLKALALILVSGTLSIVVGQEVTNTTSEVNTRTNRLPGEPLNLFRNQTLKAISGEDHEHNFSRPPRGIDLVRSFNTSGRAATDDPFFDFGSSVDDPPSQEQPSERTWQYGGFVDLAYPLDFNHPANRLFRSRGTAFRVDNVWLNMAGIYLRKRRSEDSRWGVELTAHAGKDAEFFGFSATAPNIAGFKFLRQLGPTNVSYLAPVGKGLMLQAGIFGSFIGYDSLLRQG